MATFKIFRETVLPGTLEPYAIYLIAPASKPNHVELYVTNAAGTAARRIITEADIQAMINTAVASAGSITVVADIAARDAMSPTTSAYVFVRNATGDATVSSGGATYLYDVANTVWVKISEAESLDMAVTWASLQGKPASSPAQIDAAVAASHSHTNKTQLDQIGEDVSGALTYKGARPIIDWSSVGW